jgi:8-oxo-dGTP pyrophosphatase MutT (NUDIX family)
MKQTRPRSLAICVFKNKDRILVAEGYDSVKEQLFYRPLGGSIEFGEHSRATIARELQEEIGAEVTELRYLGTIENIFTYNGEMGHEIVIVYVGRFTDSSFYERERIDAIEDDTIPFTGVWKSLTYFQQAHAPLYPDGLLELLTNDGL